MPFALIFVFFFFNDTATTEIYTLSLHDALPISWSCADPFLFGSALKMPAGPDCGVVGIPPQLTRMPAELLAKLLGDAQRHRATLPGAVERPRGGRAGREQVLHRDAAPVGALGDRLDQRRGRQPSDDELAGHVSVPAGIGGSVA